ARAAGTTCGRCFAPPERAGSRHGTGPCAGCAPRHLGSACCTPCLYGGGAPAAIITDPHWRDRTPSRIVMRRSTRPP
ncbi:hypothetical protein, partial [Burkholderia aenigmatica]|uniref:hypothetical protein n=1 Tax=Burkholderia aenigmatica TaxID=2015348 RepID=UPI001B3761E7